MRKPAFALAALLPKLTESMGEVRDLQPITEGEESQVLEFWSKNRPYIVRVNRSSTGFAKDVLAFQRFASVHLPIPKITRVGQIADHFYCIAEKLPGRTLQELCPQDLPPVLAPTARVLEVVAGSDLRGLSGFGRFDPRGKGEHKTWREFLTAIGDYRQYDWSAIGGFADLSDVRLLLRQLNALAFDCPEIRRLIHGDFGSNNVLTDGGLITGVLDWSEASIGDPLYDVANVFFWRTWLGCMQQQAMYFERTIAWVPELNRRLLCYQLRIGLREIYENAMAGDADAAAWASSRCRELIQ